MKHLTLKTLLLASLLACNINSFSQINYYYDAAGNRYMRTIVPLRTTNPDTTHTQTTQTDTIGQALVQKVTDNIGNTTTAKADSIWQNTVQKATVNFGNTTVSVFPNPTPGVVQIEVTGEMPQTQATMQVFDLTGKTVVTQPLRESSENINLSASPSGQYILKISWSGQTKEWVLVKQ